MRERMNNIMSIVKAMKPLDFIDFKEAGEDRFLIKTTCPDCLTFMQWEETAFLTINVVHILGYLDVSEGVAPTDLIKILEQNFESDEGTGAFYGVYYNSDKDIFYVSRATNNIFLPKWSDEDIADVIGAIFTRIAMNITGHPKPIIEYETESEPLDFSKL